VSDPATRSIKRIVVDFPESLYKQTEKGAAELAINRSGFIRLAVEKLVADLHRKRLERQLAQGYAEMAACSDHLGDDFQYIDSEWE
jgi:metal-responsive CopG/Arc/MetJ family transcriptional regulator